MLRGHANRQSIQSLGCSALSLHPRSRQTLAVGRLCPQAPQSGVGDGYVPARSEMAWTVSARRPRVSGVGDGHVSLLVLSGGGQGSALQFEDWKSPDDTQVPPPPPEGGKLPCIPSPALPALSCAVTPWEPAGHGRDRRSDVRLQTVTSPQSRTHERVRFRSTHPEPEVQEYNS
jgi:hypothetical protein